LESESSGTSTPTEQTPIDTVSRKLAKTNLNGNNKTPFEFLSRGGNPFLASTFLKPGKPPSSVPFVEFKELDPTTRVADIKYPHLTPENLKKL
jgi:hypothetical protein